MIDNAALTNNNAVANNTMNRRVGKRRQLEDRRHPMTTPDMVWRWRHTISMVLVTTFGFSLITFLCLRVYASYTTQHQLLVLRQQFETHLEADKIKNKVYSQRLDDLERTLFGDVATALQQQQVALSSKQPIHLERWQVERDKELRERIHQLEEWRLSLTK